MLCDLVWAMSFVSLLVSRVGALDYIRLKGDGKQPFFRWLYSIVYVYMCVCVCVCVCVYVCVRSHAPIPSRYLVEFCLPGDKSAIDLSRPEELTEVKDTSMDISDEINGEF